MGLKFPSSSIVTTESFMPTVQETRQYPELLAGCTGNYYRLAVYPMQPEPAGQARQEMVQSIARLSFSEVQSKYAMPTATSYAIPSATPAVRKYPELIAGCTSNYYRLKPEQLSPSKPETTKEKEIPYCPAPLPQGPDANSFVDVTKEETTVEPITKVLEKPTGPETRSQVMRLRSGKPVYTFKPIDALKKWFFSM